MQQTQTESSTLLYWGTNQHGGTAGPQTATPDGFTSFGQTTNALAFAAFPLRRSGNSDRRCRTTCVHCAVCAQWLLCFQRSQSLCFQRLQYRGGTNLSRMITAHLR